MTDTPVAMPEIETYPHTFQHPSPRVIEMATFKGLKGGHRSRCLCWFCKKFVPEDREANCGIANLLFTLCVEKTVVTPVAECQADRFELRDEPHPWFAETE